MTGSRAQAKRVVFLDGYAGRGRYQDGSPASAERILKIAQQQGTAGTVSWTCFFVEREDDDAAQLPAVVDEYFCQGVTATAHHGPVLDVLDQVLHTASGYPLFLFLDPCGLGIPYGRLVSMLCGERQARWPPTEVLLNFSLDAVRRIGGHVGSEHRSEVTMGRLDVALGGDWWREQFAGGVSDDAVAVVVTTFGQRLAADSNMTIVAVPVRRAPTHKPLYHLLFGTRSQHGLWSFGDSVARTTQAWWDTLEEYESEQNPPALFPVSQLQRPSLATVERRAVPEIALNLEAILRERPSFRVVDHADRLFGTYYGQVREQVVREAIKRLHQEGRTSSTGTGRRIRDLVVARP